MSYQDSNKALSMEKSGCGGAFLGAFLMFMGANFLLISFFQGEMLWQVFWGVLGMILLLTGYRYRNPKSNPSENPYAEVSEGTTLTPQLLEQVHKTTTYKNLEGYNPARLELKEAASPLTVGIVLLVIGVIWNGFILFLFLGNDNGFKGGFDWFAVLFCIPFVLGGLGILLGALYFLMATFNQRPTIGLRPGTISNGESATLDWTFDKPVTNYFEYSIKIIGEERASYTRGTDRVTDTHKFHDEILFTTDDLGEMQQGSREFSIPPHLMYSWKSTNNEIQWRLEVCGKVKMWPDMNMTLPITVLPQLEHLEKSLSIVVQNTLLEDEE